MGTMLIPDHTGHSTVQWDALDAVSTAAATDRFDALIAERLKPFRHEGGQPYSPMTSFDPAADEILWVRPLQGG